MSFAVKSAKPRVGLHYAGPPPGSESGRLHLIELAGADVMDAIGESERVGVRGGAILDFLHLIAARRSAAHTLYTLNHRHFIAIARKGDPKIEQPG